MKTKIFLDSGDPKETKEAIKLLGFLDGQTTNPSLVAKNPEVSARIEKGEKFSIKEIYSFYKQIVTDISLLIPQGSVSVEVYADKNTKWEEMAAQGEEMSSWIPNAHIKLPTTTQGLKAAAILVKKGLRVNMTLVFSQAQAAAVYSATRGAKQGSVYLSPFIGRLDDKGENGMDLIKNILQMYQAGDGHVELLTASVRNTDHFLEALRIKTDIITAPFKILKQWVEDGKSGPAENFSYNSGNLESIVYQELDLQKPWQEFDISHELTNNGLARFAEDWNALLK